MAELKIAWAVLRRDLQLELRTREGLQAMFFYALLVIVIFSFAFGGDADLAHEASGGLLWIAFLFAALVALDRAFLREASDGAMTGLLISPAPRAALLAGKFFSSLLVLLALEAVLTPLFAVLFNTPPGARWGGVAATAFLGSWALAANGTYFAALSFQTRQRGVLLPLLLLPISIPALLAMVQATQTFLSGTGMSNYWLRLLAGYDVIYSVLGLALADLVLEVE